MAGEPGNRKEGRNLMSLVHLTLLLLSQLSNAVGDNIDQWVTT